MFYNINEYIRITQYLNDDKKGWRLYSSINGMEYNINNTMYMLIQEINNKFLQSHSELIDLVRRYFGSVQNAEQAISELIDDNIVQICEEKKVNENILFKLSYKYPLTYLMFVLTNKCNLNCIHCYGDYGSEELIECISFEKIKSMLQSLNRLHTCSVAFTGGEFFLYKNYMDIFFLFAKNGYKVTIFSNGFLSDKIISFIDATSEFFYKLKISIDGDVEYHNMIRGNSTSYENALKVLMYAKKFKNIDVSVSITVLKQDYKNVNSFVEYLSSIIDRDKINMDVGFDPDVDKSHSNIFFNSCADFELLYNEIPDLFRKKSSIKQKYRCAEARTVACVDSNLLLKMCVTANHEDFIFGSLNDEDIFVLWTNPKPSIKKFRKEKTLVSKKCKRCEIKKKCTTKDCRVLAYLSNKDYNTPNPQTCFIEFQNI